MYPDIHRPVVIAEVAAVTKHEDMFQVLLHNDDHNTAEHVVDCLQRIFNHPEGLAIKIMAEAHFKGKPIAEVESETLARLHCEQLQSFGLTATLDKI